MEAHRLVKARHAASALDGEGARRVGGRWNPAGVPVAYCAASLSLSVLEMLVQVDPGELPDDLLALRLEWPADLPATRFRPEALPRNWRTEAGRPALQALGAAWIKGGETAVLLVPSVVIPSETNILINPAHGDAASIRVTTREAFSLAPRLR